MNGKASVAPCGHTGETIIGSYVRCLQGCEGKAVIDPRREPGHFNACSCFGCDVRRRAHILALRDSKGRTLSATIWDGVTSEIKPDITMSGFVSGFILSDKFGKTVYQDSYANAQGKMQDVIPGDSITVKLVFGKDSLKLDINVDTPTVTVVTTSHHVANGGNWTIVTVPTTIP